MTRLYRPHIPVRVRCYVVLTQLGEIWPDKVIDDWAYRRSKLGLGVLLETKLCMLAGTLNCGVEELRLDHDPALGNRDKTEQFVKGRLITIYEPDANDHRYLFYRPHGAQHVGSHDIKTRVRGDHGQHSDLALMRIKKKREAPPKRKRSWPSRPFAKRMKR
jgi:hypothetical protein